MKTNSILGRTDQILTKDGKTLDRVIGSATSKNTITQSITINDKSSTLIESDELYDLFLSNKGMPLLDIVNVYVLKSSSDVVVPIIAEGYTKLRYESASYESPDVPRWSAENSNGDVYLFTPVILNDKKNLNVTWIAD